MLVTAAPAQLARDYTGVLSYNIVMLAGDTNDHISNSSFRGFEVEGHRFIDRNLSWSLSWQWNTFNEALDGTFKIANGT